MTTFGQPIFTEAISATTGTPSETLGTRRVDSAGNEYVYGYNASNSLIEVGVPVVHGSNNTGYSFTITNAASQVGFVAAVCHHATIATGYYGWLMVKGLCRVVPDASQVSMAVGDKLAIGVDGGFVSAPVTISTGLRWGYTVESGVTGYGACASFATSGLDTLGRAWIKTVLG
jgi:hypothetical protein